MKFNLDSVKSAISSLKDKGAEVAGVAADKTKDAARIARLTVQLGAEKENLKKAYTELGKAYFEENKDCAEGLFAQLCEEVTAVNDRIAAMRSELDSLKGGLKTAEAPDFEQVVAEAEGEADDITVEIVETPCESCEQPTCDGCEEKAPEEAPCCCADEENKPEE